MAGLEQAKILINDAIDDLILDFAGQAGYWFSPFGQYSKEEWRKEKKAAILSALDTYDGHAILVLQLAKAIEPMLANAFSEQAWKREANAIIHMNMRQNIDESVDRLISNVYRSMQAQKERLSDKEKLKAILTKYRVSMSPEDALSDRGFRRLALLVHPDKGGSKEDFQFVQRLKDLKEDRDSRAR